MNSMQELNGFGSTRREFEDLRSYQIQFTPNTPVTQSITVGQDLPFTVTQGTDISFMRSQAGNVIYTIDVSSVPGTTVTWPSPLPAGVTSTVVSAGVYRLNNVNTVGRWNESKSAVVQMPITWANNWSFTSTINDQQGNVRSWTTNVTVNPYYSLVTSRNYAEDTGFPSNSAVTLALYDVGVDANLVACSNPGTYTLTFQQTDPVPTGINVGYFSRSGAANSSPGNLVYTGTKSAINGQEFFYAPPSDYTGNITLTYTQVLGNVTQANAVPIQLTNTGSHNEYTTPSSLHIPNPAANLSLSAYQITDQGGFEPWRPEKTYSVTITQPTVRGNFWIAATNYGSNITLTGNKISVNNNLNSLVFKTNTSNVNAAANAFLYSQTQTYDNIIQASNVATTLSIAPNLGDAFEGGYYAGTIDYNQANVGTHYLIVADRQQSDFLRTWQSGTYTFDTSEVDGETNTSTMMTVNPVGFPAANAAANFSNDGSPEYFDWYLPARYELQTIYENLKPNTSNNVINTGTNPYSVPQRNADYTSTNPAMTTATNFQESGGTEAFSTTSRDYWTSTEAVDNTSARAINFEDGSLNVDTTNTQNSVRPIRKRTRYGL